MNDFGDISMLQIEIFLTVADCKSITAAARKLYISQSTATRLIQKLELCMNTVLLERTNRGVELTDRGEKLYRLIKQLYSRMNAAFYDVRSVDRDGCEVVKVACVEANEVFDETTLLIKQFEKMYPYLTVDLTVHTFHDLREGVLAGQYDCVFTYSMSAKSLKDIEVRFLKHFDTYFAVSANSPAIEDGRLNYAKLADTPIYVRMGERYDLTAARDLSICRVHGFQPKAVQYITDEPAVAGVVMDDIGFSIAGPGFGLRQGVRLFKTEKPIEEEQFMVLCWDPERSSDSGRKFVESIPYIRAVQSTDLP